MRSKAANSSPIASAYTLRKTAARAKTTTIGATVPRAGTRSRTGRNRGPPDGPRCVQEQGIFCPVGLDDARAVAHVGERLQADDDGIDQQHHAERLGEEQSGQHKMDAQAKNLGGSQADDDPRRSGQDDRFE